ncbi:efflux RND transporter periplasmic adaptor subunit [Ferrovum sp. PN-J185]|uniref:efflux RND transporter periplasmic adaptor subunit n=1 Tax=Ferrovum sp. PN-J185 TaxID=1356306 RepID=UPI0007928B17|nr:efflux RND transporter periplasmic adaptor subunit [Ferrovum sp. PN-J185]KXW56463.1 macrolide export protein MacA [Ferrovum sp. PN-J185]MCC6068188.1 efflux RND transporter periplasmic adaptor subunit [Ferrovum sp. PN-J185]MDE1891699.1 efflux RND transporter periplasmic adaptor subunit [Betaproteobacteria bacterium]MDE2056459.1 efflux RND transporter periplasmic adaptor subunit [Betaproteobacteria bacterium]
MSHSARKYVYIGLVIIIAIGLSFYWINRPKQENNTITLYGNIDIRQVQAAFYDSGRITAIQVQEGDSIKKGQLLAKLDPIRFQEAVKQNEALVATQQQILTRLLNGSRPEEIEQARADVASAKANLINTRISYERQKELVKKQYVPKQNVDNSLAALNTAKANFDRAQQTLKLSLEGPRKEDIEAARQQLQAYQSQLAIAKQELIDTNLYALEDGIVQSRILEPGDMVSPQTPVFTLALDNPIWARVYLPEKSLGFIHPGMEAQVYTDSFPNHAFLGWVGFISPTSEFTPKNVETTELRTELVYRVRIYACNTNHQLRLGMPVTVKINRLDSTTTNSINHTCGN